MNFKDLLEKEKKLVISYKYDIFRDNCIKLKDKGVDACVSDNNFNLSGVKITNDARDLIDLAVPQIINYRGLSFDRPLEGLGIGGFYYFMFLFYFERIRQVAHRIDGQTVDRMLMRHSIIGDEMWLVNKVDEIPNELIEKYKKNSY